MRSLPTVLRLAFLLGALGAMPAAAQSGPVACTGGQATIGGLTFPCSGIDVLARVTNQQMGAAAAGACTSPYPALCANDIWGWTDPQTGREVALVGLHNGTAFVDVTVPTAPVLLGRMPTQTANSSWRDVKTMGHYAIVVSEAGNHGMQIFDLERLRGLTADASRTFTADAVYPRIGSAHNVVANEATGFAYAVGSRAQGTGLPAACSVRGFHAIDLRNPLVPVFAGCFNDADRDVRPVVAPGYTHDAQCIVYRGPDATYTGRELCVAANEDVVTVFDVTDKAAVRILSQGEYPLGAYTHQGWLTEDQRYLLVNDEEDELFGTVTSQRTLVFDMQDLDAPEYLFQYTSGLTTIDHNLYVRGRYAYESNYESGLRVLDLAGIGQGQITEAAFFDTYPQATSVAFNGQWSNYPYFASGIIVASDAANGLFVLRPTGLVAGAETPGGAGPLALSAPAPNPATGDVRLTLTVDAPQAVRAVLLDALGREVAVLFDGEAAGATEIVVPRSALPGGTYVVRARGARGMAVRTVSFAR